MGQLDKMVWDVSESSQIHDNKRYQFDDYTDFKISLTFENRLSNIRHLVGT